MSATTLIGNYLLWSMVAGSLGAVAMGVFLGLIRQIGLTKVHMIVAIGSLVTRSYEKATLVGCYMHGALGAFFGLIYAYIMVAVGHPGVWPNVLVGTTIGMLHGVAMSLVLISSVAEEHPLVEFQQRGFAIATWHWVGHIIYGIVVGAVIGASGLIQPH